MLRPRWQHLLLIALSLCASPVMAVPDELKSDVLSGSAAISGIDQFNTKLDGGGNFHWSGIIAQGELKRQLTTELSAAISARYGYESWHFSTPSALGATAPWGNINRPGIGLNFGYQAAPDVALFVAPQIEWNYETGASAGNAQNYGAVLGATKFFSPTLVLGIGAGAFRQIDKTVVFPFVIVNWQIDDHWRLSNPFQASPAGGAGLELVYAIDPQWEIAGGGTYREYRFRLRDDGPTPRGIGRNQGIPVFARLTRKLGPRGRVDFYAGAVAGGQLRVLNANGSTASSSDYKLAPLLGLTAALDF
jgi:hypothetical protein